MLFPLCLRFSSRLTKDFEIVLWMASSMGSYSPPGVSDEVVKLHLTHFVCTTEGIYSSRWRDLLGVEYQQLLIILFKCIPEVFRHFDH